jgi:hypothetical protein
MMKDLKHFESNTYSQNGEDGVIREIFSRLKTSIELDRWCVEFGAWDGVYLSNTCRLIREEEYRAVLIEGDSKRVDKLLQNFPRDEVIKVCRFVGFEGENTIDRILSETPIPKDFDFLSVDIDGVDYYIFESIRNYKPKVVCIEFNPSIPNEVDWVQDKNFNVKQGSSAKALIRLAHSKDYALVHTTACNLIFVRRDLEAFVVDHEKTIEELNVAGNDPTYLFVGYDGTLLSNKRDVNLVWHGLKIHIDQLQPLPKALRVYGGDYRTFHRLIFAFWIGFRNPSWLFKKVKQRIFK